MQTHGPSCLEGPVSGTRPWWQPVDLLPDGDAPGGAAAEEPRQPFRADLVARVRKEIAAGTYDTPEKWEAALSRLLEKLESE